MSYLHNKDPSSQTYNSMISSTTGEILIVDPHRPSQPQQQVIYIEPSPNVNPNIVFTPTPTPNVISRNLPLHLQWQDISHIPPYQRSFTQIKSLEQIWAMPLFVQGRPTWKFWYFLYYFISVIILLAIIFWV